jgi:tyrosyl-DNA phosphodiesterase-1
MANLPEKRRADYSLANEELKDLAQERRRRAEARSLLQKDGLVLYMTPLEFVEVPPSHLLSIRQLLYEDLLERGCSPKTLQSAFLTTFCMEETFIAPVARDRIEMCIVMEHPTQRGKLIQAADNVTYIIPPNSVSWGKFHPKLFLLKFPSTLRVVVTSANLMKHDWTQIGQVLWFQDFGHTALMETKEPEAGSEAQAAEADGEARGNFYTELKSFVESCVPSAYDLEGRLGIDLSQYDFSKCQVELVTSVPGRYSALDRYGQGRFRSLMKESGVRHSHFTVQCSSVGSLTPALIKAFAESFANNPEATCQLVFPSFETVKASHNGPPGGGTSFLKEEYWNSRSFPKEIMHDFDGPRDFPNINRHLSHSKVVICHSGTVDDDTALYIGSHNLSSAAWGKYEKQGRQLFIGNYELGIIFMPKSGSAALKRALISRLPFKFPPDPYQAGVEPWFVEKYGDV